MVTAPAGSSTTRPTSWPRSRPASSTARLRRGDPLPGPGAPTACPSCTSSRPRSACCRTAASGSRSSPTAACPARPGKVPAAIHVTPEAAARRPAGAGARRRRDHRRRRRRRARRCTSPTTSSPPVRRPAAHPSADEWPAPGASCSPAFRAAVGPADAGRQRLSRLRRTTAQENLVVQPSDSLLDRVPVVPVVVVDDVDHAVPLARALVAGGLPVIELTLRTPVALDAIERSPTRCPRSCVGAGTIVDARPGQAGGRRRRAVPGLAREHADAARRDGRHRAALPARASPRSPRCWPSLEAGYTEMKFFPAEAVGRRARS